MFLFVFLLSKAIVPDLIGATLALRRYFMGKKLYVGNLPFSATDDSLLDAFSQFGKVESAKIITDKMSGRSKGFGFVEMSSDAEANTAINSLNGKDFGGRNMMVSEARPMEPRENRGGGFGGGRGGRDGGSRGRY
jgi:RNA recognition motif-containing protein